MPSLNWEVFARLPGAETRNFEMLCRSLIRRHYAQFGEFRALANQPGVEFHLKLNSPCCLGRAGHWFAWQCKWYDLPNARALSNSRRTKILDAIAKSEKALPELTDWILWTKYPLTKSDQTWFFNINTKMRLDLWTQIEVEELLNGPAAILRGSYFDELVLTPERLRRLHELSSAPIKKRWLPEAHQVLEAEREIRRALGTKEAWSDLSSLAVRISSDTEAIRRCMHELSSEQRTDARATIEIANGLCGSLNQIVTALGSGDYEIIRQEVSSLSLVLDDVIRFGRRLRASRHRLALVATNLTADLCTAARTLIRLHQSLDRRVFCVIADAGYGKTQLAGQMTAEYGTRPAGILLHGSCLRSRNNLDDLTRCLSLDGRPISTFEALAAALDAAGRCSQCRLPIFIDGLNEAEDPRNWSAALASAQAMLTEYPFILLICTIRPEFLEDAVPGEVEKLRLTGFQADRNEAISRYFEYYRIEPRDRFVCWELLGHPLLLRMFCEVTNPNRDKTVGLESMPTSLGELFDRYLKQVTKRICELAPREWRFFDSDVRTALSKICLELWQRRSRNITIKELRALLEDNGRPWDQSLVRALEQDGILIRIRSYGDVEDQLCVVFDALAGHLIADALLERLGGDTFKAWLSDAEFMQAFSSDYASRHPLASDIFRGFVDLVPRRRHRQHFWKLVQSPLREVALCEAAWLEAEFLDGETISALATLIAAPSSGNRDILDRLWIMRAVPNHPLNAEFFDEALRLLTMPDRDLRWSEWVRRRQADLLDDLRRLEDHWNECTPNQGREKLRARWIMWILTTTNRLLRDHATRALYTFGCNEPSALFDLTLGSQAVNDPYVPERMLAACYGVAMSLWADPGGDVLRAGLPVFANKLVDRVFAPDATYGTCHALMRDSALGVIRLAQLVKSQCISDDRVAFLNAPSPYLQSPFPQADAVSDVDSAAGASAIDMDFGNYTIGRLIPDRGNYDYTNPTYRDVRRQIEGRIVQLGYAPSRFGDIDKQIASEKWRPGGRNSKVDRYGKKYSWIAYFEMYGLRNDCEQLPDSRAGERTTDVDIDPSFPQTPRIVTPLLPALFGPATRNPRKWILNGPTPNYSKLLKSNRIDNQDGPWILLDGFVEQYSQTDERRVFTFMRSVLVDKDSAKILLTEFSNMDYPGNDAIPEPYGDYYTYVGEIPWSRRFGSGLRDSTGKPERDIRGALRYYDGQQWRGDIPIEIPVCRFYWESYHSELNQVSNILIPAPAICSHFGLVNRKGQWDYYDSSGRIASLYREFGGDRKSDRSQLLYLRSDLLSSYLKSTGQVLVWMLWGERTFDHNVEAELRKSVVKLFQQHKHIHRRSAIWPSKPQPGNRKTVRKKARKRPASKRS